MPEQFERLWSSLITLELQLAQESYVGAPTPALSTSVYSHVGHPVLNINYL
jgi:hypothetical protein